MKRTNLNAAIASVLLSSIGGGDDAVQIQLSYPTQDAIPEAFRPLYTQANGEGAFQLSGVAGIKTQDDINALQGALNKEREDHKTVKATLGRLGDRSIDDVLAVLDKVPAWEALEAGNDPEKIQSLVDAKLSQHTAPLEREKSELTNKLDIATKELKDLQHTVKTEKIMSALTKAAIADKVLPEAAEDIAQMGLPLFDINDAGEVVVKADAQGVTPGVLPQVWLNDLKQTRSFYWPASQGAGGQGGKGGQGGTNPWAKESFNLTEQGKLVVSNPTLARQYCEQAGHPVNF